MKAIIKPTLGLLALYFAWYGLTQPIKVSAKKTSLPESTQAIKPAEAYATPSPSVTPTSPQKAYELGEVIETINPTPSPVVEPSTPLLEDVVTKATVPNYYQTNASMGELPPGYGGWHLRRDPCYSDSCLFPHFIMLSPGYRVKVLDQSGLPSNIQAEWVKVRVFFTNGEIVGYVHKSGVVYD